MYLIAAKAASCGQFAGGGLNCYGLRIDPVDGLDEGETAAIALAEAPHAELLLTLLTGFGPRLNVLMIHWRYGNVATCCPLRALFRFGDGVAGIDILGTVSAYPEAR